MYNATGMEVRWCICINTRLFAFNNRCYLHGRASKSSLERRPAIGTCDPAAQRLIKQPGISSLNHADQIHVKQILTYLTE